MAPSDRLDQLVESALHVFAQKGYARTQMAEVAREMGVSQGTLYNYVESKEALFALLIERGVAGDEPVEVGELPVRTPPPGTTARRLRERLVEMTRLPVLARALERGSSGDPAAELTEILQELYELVARSWRAAAVIERSALDEPDLAALYYVEVRRSIIERLTQYLESRIEQSQLRAVPDTAASARLIVEAIAWFAFHRHGDPDSATIDDQTAQATVVDFVVASLRMTDAGG
ncbi:MAG TPA: helix-turn-helix domain-containing protein [Candidatus Limnocylindria bacterium]|nr:helix-turn-helix domain-containing protein [Candidatus Limnocylindria bacterium]